MNNIGLIFAILASITWGLVYVLDQKVLSFMSPLLWLALSSLVITILTFPILILQQDSLKEILHSGSRNLLLIFISQILIALASYFIFSSIKHLGASKAAVFEITYPFFVIIFSLIAFGGKLSVNFFLGSILIFTGSIILIKYA